MDCIDFDDIASALSAANKSECRIHFLEMPEDHVEDGEFHEPNEICFGVTAVQFTDALSWVQHRAQPFSNRDIPRVVFEDPEGVLQINPRSYAVLQEDYQALFARLESSHAQVINSGW
jgi:hypothetical protein